MLAHDCAGVDYSPKAITLAVQFAAQLGHPSIQWQARKFAIHQCMQITAMQTMDILVPSPPLPHQPFDLCLDRSDHGIPRFFKPILLIY